QEACGEAASFVGQLENQRGTVELTETVITSRMGLYLAAGVAQNSIVKVAQFGIRKV
ncbi:SGNH/GDSL hydrolase family protein, partial [Pseudomonas syringae]|nr:SGNH/GDSL hydrolase family protein [Pseudomonas syringae]